MRLFLHFLLLLSLLIIGTVVVMGEEADTTAEKIQVYSDMIRYGEDEIVQLEGNVEIFYLDYIITAERGVFDRGNDELTLEGDVVVIQDETRVESREMWMNIRTEHIIFTGNVDALFYYEGGGVPLLGMGNNDEDEDGDDEVENGEREPIQIWSEHLEVVSETDLIIARDQVRAIYQDMVITADEAILDQADETLTMEGDVQIERDDGSWYAAERFIYFMEDGTFTAYRIRSEFFLP